MLIIIIVNYYYMITIIVIMHLPHINDKISHRSRSSSILLAMTMISKYVSIHVFQYSTVLLCSKKINKNTKNENKWNVGVGKIALD